MHLEYKKVSNQTYDTQNTKNDRLIYALFVVNTKTGKPSDSITCLHVFQADGTFTFIRLKGIL